ncbi:MAG: hypothetical protein ACRD28_14980, partial [Acidobacteriaceae bacterium]
MNINTQPAANGYENNQREQQIRSVSAFFRSLFRRAPTAPDPRTKVRVLPLRKSRGFPSPNQKLGSAQSAQ